jgi:acyl-CoA synthetase (NDP forming)
MKKFFKGEVYVKDVNGEEGQNIEALPKVPELAVLMLPPEKSIIRGGKMRKNGCKGFIIITGGYKDEQRRELLRLKENMALEF